MRKSIINPQGLPWAKRGFDVLASSLLIIALFPVLICIALAIRLESKGSVFYAAKRVGRGYQVFPFFKFRSMVVDADKRLASIQHLNQYQTESTLEAIAPETALEAQTGFTDFVVSDEGAFDETSYKVHQQAQGQFVKVVQDPRITRVGKFLRNTSLDELPQLFNVLLGHMSLVGNRPLPLYEAEQMTTDMAVERFSAPAGITGLWQVKERGGSEADPEKRIAYDVEYARTASWKLDFWILFKTPLAALQRESV